MSAQLLSAAVGSAGVSQFPAHYFFHLRDSTPSSRNLSEHEKGLSHSGFISRRLVVGEGGCGQVDNLFEGHRIRPSGETDANPLQLEDKPSIGGFRLSGQ